MAGFRKAVAYAWHGSGRRWDAVWLQSLGGLIGGFLIWLWGLKVPAAILDNPLLGAVVAIAIGAIVGALIAFLLRLCWWPFHHRLELHGGLHAFLRSKLGDFMWPAILTASGLIAFVLLTGGGVIWLAWRAFDGQACPKTMEATPNTIGNPDFALFVPEDRYQFTWPSSNLMNFYLRRDSERNPDMTNNPAFLLRNRTNTVAYRISVAWKSETALNLKDEVKSPKLSKAQFAVSETRLDIISTKESGPLGNFMYYLDDTPKQIIDVIAKEAEVYFPQSLWPLAAIYLIGRLPDKIGETSPPFVARVTLNWETSEGKQRREYRVKITATNAKGATTELPVIDAYLNFSLEEIGR